MAEVLQPMISSSSTVTMLHSRTPSSEYQNSSQSFPQSPRLGQAARGMYNGQGNTYRGVTAAVQPYAFQQAPQPRLEQRSVSLGAIGSHRHTQSVAGSTASSSDTSSVPSTKDDSVMGSHHGSLVNFSSAMPDLTLNPLTPLDSSSSPKQAPGRYRRQNTQRSDSSYSVKNASSQLETPPPVFAPSDLTKTDSLGQQQAHSTVSRTPSADDVAVAKSASASESAKRYRRRSMNNLETQALNTSPTASNAIARPGSAQGPTSTPTTIRPVFAHQRTASGSSYDAQAPSKPPTTSEGSKPAATTTTSNGIAVPPRGASDVNRRVANPSPLSRNVDSDSTPPSQTKSYAAAVSGSSLASPAAQQLAAVSDRDLNKGMKSRLRRAFSFGSAQELRKASGENSAMNAVQMREQHQSRIDDELDPEQRAIAARQEAAGFGASIYSGQGGFTGSTDNLSISSTASSASMMLRKMGRGAKKGAKSVKGLFRPKSVIGVPAADGPVNVQSSAAVLPSVGQVSRVNVEAERQKVNVNAEVSETRHGGVGFPKLERNSLDAAGATIIPVRGSAETTDSQRRSIIGSDKDRAEVLAAVRKGILKRTGTGSPAASPDIKPVDTSHLIESPASSMPSTPKDSQQLRAGSLSVNGDYFSTRLPSAAKSAPDTPTGTSLARNISFSPRIQFHDAWSSTEYDRRGEIATCNRLTPMLAQQIKEELNTFKMEMEVHELSKPHTHFF